MIKLLIFFLVIGLFLVPVSIFGMEKMPNKQVHLQAGQSTLGATLKTISLQTFCVFSYDPTIVNEKQVVNVPNGFNYSLQTALKKILPSNIQFKFKDKYILLLKCATVQSKLVVANNVQLSKVSQISKPITKDSTINNDVAKVVPISNEPTIVQSIAIVEPSKTIESDSNITITKFETVKPKTPVLTKSKQSFGKILFQNSLLEVEFAAYNSMVATSLHVGFYGIYAILAYGKNKDQFTSRGVGLGSNLQIHKGFGAIVELERETQLTGKTYDLGVRTELTIIKPLLKYRFGKSVSMFAGPTFNMFNSKYVNAVKTFDLGKTFYYGAIFGVKMDLLALSRKN